MGMQRLIEILNNGQPEVPQFCWEKIVVPPQLEGWTFDYYCESHISAGETIEDAMARQVYRVIAKHKDGMVGTTTSTKGFGEAYRELVDMILKGGWEK